MRDQIKYWNKYTLMPIYVYHVESNIRQATCINIAQAYSNFYVTKTVYAISVLKMSLTRAQAWNNEISKLSPVSTTRVDGPS